MSGEVNVQAMLGALSNSDPALRVALLKRLERVGDGMEKDLGELLPTAGLELGMGLLRALHTIGTPAAREAMLEAKKSTAAIVRIEALANLEPGGERLNTEIRDLLTSGDPKERLDGLLALETYKIKAAASALAIRIRSQGFDVLPVEERRQALSALGALVPERVEKVALGLLTDQRALSAQEHEPTREIACEVLGRFGSAQETRDALAAAAMTRFRTTEAVRQAARHALDAFDARAQEAKNETKKEEKREDPPRGST
jgi:hypothetical protein